MTDKPRIGYADKARGAHLHAPPRYLPIVVVPTFMGSRLSDPKSGGLVWNPLGFPFGNSPKGFAIDYARMTQVTAELVPDETHGADAPTGDTGAIDAAAKERAKVAQSLLDPSVKVDQGVLAKGQAAQAALDQAKSDYLALQQVRHVNNLVTDFYDDLIKKLANLDLGDDTTPLKPRIYAAGYDWRQDHARSALRLAAVVEEALAETRERKVVIIAHGSGGHVARYYSRALGGETKILHMILIGSPIMGFPEAYSYLKHGIPGLYIRDFIENTDPRDRAAEAISEIGTLGAFSGIASGTRVGAGFMMSYGLFFALCLGAGRYLRRKETLYFVRQLPALYQLMPGALYCRDHHDWLIFDPFATGHLPTGFMLVFPTLFQDLMAIISGIANAASPAKAIGDKMTSAVNGFLAPEEAERTSVMATLMYETIQTRMSNIVQLLQGNYPYALRWGQVAPTGFPNFLAGVARAGEVFQRVAKFFMDCRSSRTLYSDIYTGLLDLPEQRALCGQSLALAFRLDEALTVDPCPVDPLSPMDLLKTAFMAMLGGIAGPPGTQTNWLTEKMESAVTGAASDAKKAQEKQAKAKAYVHPSTVVVYSNTTPVEAGALLFPLDILSNFDSNKVEWMLLPGSILSIFALLMSPPGAGNTGFGSQEFGDGTVPMASANPPADALSAPLVSSTVVPATAHMDLCGAALTLSTVAGQIKAKIPDFIAS